MKINDLGNINPNIFNNGDSLKLAFKKLKEIENKNFTQNNNDRVDSFEKQQDKKDVDEIYSLRQTIKQLQSRYGITE